MKLDITSITACLGENFSCICDRERSKFFILSVLLQHPPLLLELGGESLLKYTTIATWINKVISTSDPYLNVSQEKEKGSITNKEVHKLIF